MTDIKYNEEELKTQLDALLQCFNQINSSNESYNSKMATIDSFWLGSSCEDYKIMIRQINMLQAVASEKLRSTIIKLERIIGVYSKASDEAEKRNEGLPTEGIFLE